ncbi:PQQ-like beta-propeller repeat protein [Streptomyces sp. NBC_01275]|uniref:outer membrane protein assembly factor BamB family protein n=1 Tax=Streptomyces sp. NBC_01275 TaxID=2903807 RepID=UPI00224F6C70|nr:PQQ-binding-like beta-propeller repeat protein [Streptomyces sp. NBC_01275]MCX4765399.1 PQQ-like beta-propeller repeat protein [Streptomyces sp. NBC_01275]
MSFGPPPSLYTQSTVTAEALQRTRRRKWAVGLLALVLVAALGVGGWLLRSGADDGTKTSDQPVAAGQGRLDVRESVEEPPASTVGKMAFRFSVDDMGPGEHFELPGMWATDKILAKGINKTVVGLTVGTDASPGDEKWKLPLDGPICGYTRHVTGDNRTAVLFRANDRGGAYCNHVAFFDLDDGREVWEGDFPYSQYGDDPGMATGGDDQDAPSVTLTHGTVVVTWGGGTDAYSMDTGKRRWRTTSTGACQDMGAAGGGALIVRQQCWNDDESLPVDSLERVAYKARKIDPNTGDVLWTYSAAKGIRDLDIPSAEPAVLAVQAGEIGISELLSLDAEGADRATIRLQNGTYVGECSTYDDYLVVDDCPTIAVGADQVFLRSKETGDKADANWIVGFELATGNTTKKFDSGPGSLLYPVRMSGGRLLALRESDDHIAPTALVGLDPKTGKETPYFYFNLPAEAETMTMTEYNDILVQDGRVFFGRKKVDGPTADEPKWIYLVLGIESTGSTGSAGSTENARNGENTESTGNGKSTENAGNGESGASRTP